VAFRRSAQLYGKRLEDDVLYGISDTSASRLSHRMSTGLSLCPSVQSTFDNTVLNYMASDLDPGFSLTIDNQSVIVVQLSSDSQKEDINPDSYRGNNSFLHFF
jgi:hypothetical protein